MKTILVVLLSLLLMGFICWRPLQYPKPIKEDDFKLISVTYVGQDSELE